jgi:hypothetical protein
MLAVAVGVALVLRNFMPTYLAALLAGALLVGWFRINVRAALKGLARANLRAYFVTRERGASHEEALAQMVASRYPFSPERATRLLAHFALASTGMSQRDQLRALVFMVFIEENGPPPPPLAATVQRNIDQELGRLSIGSGLSL